MNQQNNEAFYYYPQTQHLSYYPSQLPNLVYKVENLKTLDYSQTREIIHINKAFIRSIQGLIRVLIIISSVATIISSALVENRDFAVRTESNYNVSVWMSTLVLSSIELALSILILLIFTLNIPNVPDCKPKLCILIVAVLDFAWFSGLIILACFCAKRESDTHEDFRNVSLSIGAFGATSAFAFATGLLLIASAILSVASISQKKDLDL